MAVIQSISFRKVLNSHIQFTNEFIVRLTDGSIGEAASPQGETISIYEDKRVNIDPRTIIQNIQRDGMIGKELDQAGLDGYLQEHIPYFGRNNAYGISEAFFAASSQTRSIFELFGLQERKLNPPRLCLNILNGGKYAYTNPVLSDFSEYLLVAKSLHFSEVMEEHAEIQRVVKKKQSLQSRTVVAGNPVHCFTTRDNREVIDFLLGVVDGLALADRYDLMIDASAGDLWKDGRYRLEVTNEKTFSSAQFVDHWLDLIRQYHIRFLEDPFSEKDYSGWQKLTATQKYGYIIGDNLYSSDEKRILEGAKKRYANAVVLKLNQAGTVTAFWRALEAARSTRQIIFTSHRSISTGSTLLSSLTCLFGAQYIKIGPLVTDFSSVLRLNEILRIME